MAEAIWIAALHYHNRLEICRKFIEVAAGDDAESLDALYDIGAGRCGEERNIFKGNLKRLTRREAPNTSMLIGEL